MRISDWSSDVCSSDLPSLALDLAIFLMANRVVYHASYVRDHTTFRTPAASLPIFSFRDEESLASHTLDEQRQALDTRWAGLPTLSERFDAFRTLDDPARGAWVAFAVAQPLEVTLNVADSGRAHG